MSEHSTRHNSLNDCTVALLYPDKVLFARAKGGEIGPIVLRSDFSGGVGSYARHRFLRFRQNQRPGVGPLRPRPRDHPVGNHSVYIYIVMERGTLCAQMTEGRVAAPLSHYFSAPRFGAGKICRIFPPPPRSCTLTMEHIIMISSLTFEAINRDCRFYNPALTYEDYGHLAQPRGQNLNAEITAKGGRLNDEQVS